MMSSKTKSFRVRVRNQVLEQNFSSGENYTNFQVKFQLQMSVIIDFQSFPAIQIHIEIP